MAKDKKTTTATGKKPIDYRNMNRADLRKLHGPTNDRVNALESEPGTSERPRLPDVAGESTGEERED